MRESNAATTEQVSSIEFSERPWTKKFWVSVVIFFAALLATPPSSHFLRRLAHSTIKNHINRTTKKSDIFDLGRVAGIPSLKIRQPYSGLEESALAMLYGHSTDSDVASVLAPGTDERIAKLPLFLSLKASRFEQPLGALRLFDYFDEEGRAWNAMASAPYRSFGQMSRASWVNEGFYNIAHSHFERRDYFLGIAAVQDAIRRARVRKIDNLNGRDGLTRVISPLLVIEAFFPVAPEDVSEPGRDLNQEALLVLESNFKGLAEKSLHSPGTLYAYAMGVTKLNDKAFEDSLRIFSSIRDQEPNQKRRELSAFMAVRSAFWMSFEQLRATRPKTESEVAAQVLAPSVGIDTVLPPLPPGLRPPGDQSNIVVPSIVSPAQSAEEERFGRLAEIFARTLARELGRVQPHDRPDTAVRSLTEPQRSARVSPKVIAAQRLICASGGKRIADSYAHVGSPFWRSEASVYLDAFKGECNGIR